MNSRALLLSVVACSLVVASSSKYAGAQEAQLPPSAPTYAPPPPVVMQPMMPGQAVAPQPMYPAPLSQATQPSYIPQSVALSGPEELTEWNEGEPIPPGYHPVDRTRKGLIIAGATTFGALYGISLLTATIGADTKDPGETNPTASMYVPAVGPFIEMAHSGSATANLFLAVDGLAQTAGLTMLIYGLTVPRTILVRNDLAEAKPMLTVAPILAKGTTGLGVLGTF